MGQLLKYADDEFRYLSSAEIVVRVGNSDPSLATMTAAAITELERVGWLGNPAVDKLYSMNTSGTWQARPDPNKREDLFNQRVSVPPTVAAAVLDANSEYQYVHRRIGTINITADGAGAAADQELVPAVAGYKARMEIISIVPLSTDAATNLTFEDGDATGVVGLPGTVAMNFAASTRNTQLTGCIFYTATANKNLRVDVAGYAALGTLTIQFYYWYEV